MPADITWTSPGPDHRSGADAVLVLEGAFENVGNDLHVPVSVRVEPRAGPHAILVDHPQWAKSHVLCIVMAEREGVAAVEPAEVVGPALGGRSQSDHGMLRECLSAA